MRWRFWSAAKSKTPPPGSGVERHPLGVSWIAAHCLCTTVTLMLVIGIAAWGMYHDFENIRQTFMISEIGRVRSHAERTVSYMQEELRRSADPFDLKALHGNPVIRSYWKETIDPDESRLYGAVVDTTGKIIMHLEEKLEGKDIGAVWYDRVVPEAEAGPDVVDTSNAALTGGPRVLDIRVPIIVNGVKLGYNHVGMETEWLDKQVAARQALSRPMWLGMLGAIFVVVVAASFVLYQISRRIALIRESLKIARSRRFAEIGQLMTGLVHEIRNPLNAIRLNLHVLSRYLERREQDEGFQDESADFDQKQVVQESVQEIDRVEGLMRTLLGYTRAEQPAAELLEVRREVEATLAFLRPLLERDEVAVAARFPSTGVQIKIARDRLRQIMINLLKNAKDATGPNGQIQVTVAGDNHLVEIVVADDGPGVPAADRERIFEPFYSTKDDGAGLGLALVRRYVEEVGGWVSCEANESRGARFCLQFPAVAAAAESAVTNFIPGSTSIE